MGIWIPVGTYLLTGNNVIIGGIHLRNGDILAQKYEMNQILGQGGMSKVYLCRDIKTNKLWAAKEIRKQDKEEIDLLAEPKLLKNLDHPGIPQVVDVIEEEQYIYIIESYIEGETLDNKVKRVGVVQYEEICSIALQLCNIFEYLHSFNPPIIYRDLKPSNIMISPQGKVVLIDFGTSRRYKINKENDTVFMGSKGYAAPEQYGLAQSTEQTDIYGLGATMYYMVIGTGPQALLSMLNEESFHQIKPDHLKRLIQKSMQFDAKSRFQSMGEVKEEILTCLRGCGEEKTRLLGKLEEDASRTLVLQHKIKRKKTLQKRKKPKAVIAAAVLLLSFFVSSFLWNQSRNVEKVEGKPVGQSNIETVNSVKTIESTKAETAQKKVDDEAENSKEEASVALTQDVNQTGNVYLSIPIYLGSEEKDSNENTDKHQLKKGEKGKSKGSLKVENQKEVFYEIKPKAYASFGKEQLQLNLDYIELQDNVITFFGAISNSTGETVSLVCDKDTYLEDALGELNVVDQGMSSDVSTIRNGTRAQVFKLAFPNAVLNAGILKVSVKLAVGSECVTKGQLTLHVYSKKN